MSKDCKPSNTYIERVFSLPIGYIDNHKGNDPALDQLLKIVEIYPWMLNVADAQFDPKIADQYLVLQAVEIKHSLSPNHIRN